MNMQTITGTLTNLKRLNNSLYGNPNYSFTLITDNGVEIPVTTYNNVMDSYKLSHRLEGKSLEVVVKVNRKSNKMLSFEEV